MSRMQGVVVGIVKSVQDPQNLGRVQVFFPWLSDDNRSQWARMATLMTGPKRGSWFMPEVDDEVLVAFEHGDVQHPYIVGFLWNGADKPPESDCKNRVILTPGGHTLRFEDTDNNKKIIIRSSNGHTIALDDTPGGQTITLTTKINQQMVELDDKGQGSIKLQGGGRSIVMQAGVVQIT
jgi:uncharacterized protein involved in type VI secretion and phage assembly